MQATRDSNNIQDVVRRSELRTRKDVTLLIASVVKLAWTFGHCSVKNSMLKRQNVPVFFLFFAVCDVT